MATVDILASKFKGVFSPLNNTHSLSLTRLKCIKFAQVVGNSHFKPAFARTTTALALANYRAMAVRCVLDFGQAKIRRRNEYVQLESSEKINLSYWLGMTFSAVAAHEVLKVRRLTHALRQHGLRKVNKKSKSLADLVGRDTSGRWHVIEAKGRQNSPNATDRGEWKTQARTVGSINGTKVSTRSYCVGLIADPCAVELVDPPSKEPNSQSLKIDEFELGDGYYAPFRKFLAERGQNVKRGERSYVMRVIAADPISGDYIYVGLEERFMKAFDPQNPDVDEVDNESLYVGTDGVAIAASEDPCTL